MTDRLAWGVLGTGGIARAFARAVNRSDLGRIAAVGSRSQESADAYGEQYGVPARYPNYQAVLDDPSVQAVYVSPPHPFHAEWALKAIAAGKHVLCEKPMAMDYADSARIVAAARDAGVLLLEAFAYRCHPRTERIAGIIRSGAIGEPRLVQANHGITVPFRPEGRHFNHALGGGGILDVGCYCTSFALLIASGAAGEPGTEPMDLTATGRIGETGVDEEATATLTFASGMVAQVATGLSLRMENVAHVYGTEARLIVPDPWGPGRDSRLYLSKNDSAEPEEIVIEAGKDLYVQEADFFVEHVPARRVTWPAMTLEDSLANMRTLDRWREAIGLQYDLG
jgi:predicted dehydrogenase